MLIRHFERMAINIYLHKEAYYHAIPRLHPAL